MSLPKDIDPNEADHRVIKRVIQDMVACADAGVAYVRAVEACPIFAKRYPKLLAYVFEPDSHREVLNMVLRKYDDAHAPQADANAVDEDVGRLLFEKLYLPK